MKEKNRKILNKILIFVFGKRLHSIMYTMKELHKSLLMKILLKMPFIRFLKDIMLQFLLMDRQGQERPILWKASNIVLVIPKEVLFLEVWKRFSDLFRCNQVKILRLWLGLLTCRFIMK